LRDAEATSYNFKMAMFISVITFSFPVRTVMIIIFASRSGRNYKILNISTMLDLALFVSVIFWLLRYEYLQNYDTRETIEGINPSDRYILFILSDIRNDIFRMDILLASVTGLFWLKIFFLLKLTRTFGPMIKIIMSMIKDLSTFAVIWSI